MILYILCLWLVIALMPGNQLAAQEKLIETIGFGSCLKEGRDCSALRAAATAQPHVFVFLGDNIYADTEDMAVMRAKYDLLGKEDAYQALKKSGLILATWDDHDYGKNDAGNEYPMRRQAQKEFLRFFEIPENDPRHSRDGVYSSTLLGPPGKRTQMILLDTRFFRSPHQKWTAEEKKAWPPGEKKQRPVQKTQDSPDATVLGESQWTWLAEQLKQPAELRIIGSSIQVLPTEHRFETWGVFPRERHRFFSLLKESGARAVILLSGDRHHGEISRLSSRDPAGGLDFDLYEITASGLNQGMKRPITEPNRLRIGEPYSDDHFGLLEIQWGKDGAPPTINATLRDTGGKTVRQTEIKF
jgi:alkaline phosphatase D